MRALLDSLTDTLCLQGFNVLKASNGFEALELLHDQTPVLLTSSPPRNISADSSHIHGGITNFFMKPVPFFDRNLIGSFRQTIIIAADEKIFSSALNLLLKLPSVFADLWKLVG